MKRLSFAVIFLALLLVACRPPASPTPSISGAVVAAARRDKVLTVANDGSRHPLPAASRTQLHVGEGVDVDSNGDALLQFADLLVVEITRNGNLQLKEFHADDESALVELLQTTGVLIGNFNPQQEINRRLTIDAGFAEIVVTGTRFLIEHEEKSPLLWVVGLDAVGNDLQVRAGGVSKEVVSGQARWVAPIGEPSSSVQVDLQTIEEWLDALRTGRAQQDLGDRIWSQPDVLAPTTGLSHLPTPGEPFALNGVILTLSPTGMNGNPGYSLDDCNGDGSNDIVMEMGEIDFDFRNVLARVNSLDVTIRNFTDPESGELRVFDPAREEIAPRRLITVGPDEYEILDLRSPTGQVYHYATLSMSAGCFLGFSLTPSNAAPRPAVPLETPTPSEITPEPLPLPDLSASEPTIVEGNRIECAYANIGEGTVTESSVFLFILINGERVSYGTISTPIAPGGSGWLRSQPLDLPAQMEATCIIDARDQVQETNESNNRAEAMLTSNAGCPYSTAEAFTVAQEEMDLGCAQSKAYDLTAAWQPFAYGSMIWRKDTDLLYVLVAEATVTPLIPPGEWRSFANEWRSGMPEYACREAEALAEEGRPVHFGFGLLWCNDSYLRETVGEPLQDEIGGERWFQSFEHGWAMHVGEWEDSIVVVRDDGYWALLPR